PKWKPKVPPTAARILPTDSPAKLRSAPRQPMNSLATAHGVRQSMRPSPVTATPLFAIPVGSADTSFNDTSSGAARDSVRPKPVPALRVLTWRGCPGSCNPVVMIGGFHERRASRMGSLWTPAVRGDGRWTCVVLLLIHPLHDF